MATPIDSFKMLILAFLGVIGATAVTGFSVYLAVGGEWGYALLYFALACSLSLPFLYGRGTGDPRRVGGVALCMLDTLAYVLVAWKAGPAVLYWLPLVLVSNFFIAMPLVATLCNLSLVLAVLLMPGLYHSPHEPAMLAVTSALMTLFAYLMARQVRGERHNLETMAAVDPLTGVPNRRSMESALANALRNRDKDGTQYSLVMLDLDHFKDVNDTFGHAVGDVALTDLANILKLQMRRNDAVFRFGGEEFVVLLEIGGHDQVSAIAERLRLAVRKSLRSPKGPITVSLGAAILGDEENWQEWFSLADTALYQAKNNGRDRSVVYATDT